MEPSRVGVGMFCFAWSGFGVLGFQSANRLDFHGGFRQHAAGIPAGGTRLGGRTGSSSRCRPFGSCCDSGRPDFGYGFCVVPTLPQGDSLLFRRPGSSASPFAATWPETLAGVDRVAGTGDAFWRAWSWNALACRVARVFCAASPRIGLHDLVPAGV